jgi:CubicO group peptidase (beta-lactamase class C family)
VKSCRRASAVGRQYLGIAHLLTATAAAAVLRAQDHAASAIDAYLRPYVQSNNFAGVVRVEHRGALLFERAYGLADRETGQANTPATCFHVASVSMQFTAAAILRLVDAGTLHLEQSVGDLLPGTEGASQITIRDLLTERSGLPDINEQPDYAELLHHHQTPATLVAHIGGRPLVAAPGTPSRHEEHSAYNLLALIVERATDVPFAVAVRQLVFTPLHLEHSFVDDDSMPATSHAAHGYAPAGVDGLGPADPILWSGKSGNGSVCTTVGDQSRLVQGLLSGPFLRAPSRQAVFDTVPNVGYGWFKGDTKPFAGVSYRMSGRAPGFASFVLHNPRESLTVIVFSNVYSSATMPMGYDVARAALGLPYTPFQRAPFPSTAALRALAGRFQFGPDFYQKNAIMELVPGDSSLALHWPSGDLTELIPTATDAYIDRSYWQTVGIARDTAGHPTRLTYGTFSGAAVPTR